MKNKSWQSLVLGLCKDFWLTGADGTDQAETWVVMGGGGHTQHQHWEARDREKSYFKGEERRDARWLANDVDVLQRDDWTIGLAMESNWQTQSQWHEKVHDKCEQSDPVKDK